MDLILILLLAAVLCVPITQRLGLGAIPGYLIAGVLIGPSCLKLVTNVDTMISVSQWGVVMMLFIIGLELSPKRLWAMRSEVFVLGSLQMLACGLLLGLVFGAALRHLAGMEWQAAVLCGLSLALSSTAVALRLLDERTLTRTPLGRSALGVLLFQDMAAIPMLVAAGLLGSDGTSAPSFKEALIAVTVVAVAYRLRLLGWAAKAQLNELFTAAALLMVVGAAQLFDYAGLSAGLGGFLVGVLMAESRYRHDLEKAIDPFKGLLLGLFFLAIACPSTWGWLRSTGNSSWRAWQPCWRSKRWSCMDSRAFWGCRATTGCCSPWCWRRAGSSASPSSTKPGTTI